MKNLRRSFERFCYKNRHLGIPNLMLYLVLGSAMVFLFSIATNNPILYYYLQFDRALILKGQVWRLITYPLLPYSGSLITILISYICYYSLGRAMENVWGTLRFNLFYFSGVVMMDIYCMIFGGQADVYYLNLSLFLGYATLYPNAQFLLLYIIPVRAWIFALLDLALVVYGLVTYDFPDNLFSVISLANYFLFFGKDVLNVIPVSWQLNARRLFRKKPKKTTGAVPFPGAGSYEASTARVKAPYNHRCVVCGRTDVSNPELEFRYCSRCKGYFCYCQEHISNHTHVE